MTRAAAEPVEITVERLGSQGDGIGFYNGEAVRLPFALPGERWQARLTGRRRDGWDAAPTARLRDVPRAEPPCVHFQRCGGCRMQHVPPVEYEAFKRQRIVSALERRGLGDVDVVPPLVSPPGARRRLRLGWQRTAGGTVLGLRERRSHRIVDLEMCPVSSALLTSLFNPLREVLGDLAPAGEALLTETRAGADLVLELPRAGSSVLGGLSAMERFAELAATLDLARIAVGDGSIVARREPHLRLADTIVAIPPGVFLQATAEGEAALQAAVAEATKPGDAVIDLYAGIGTLGLAALAAGASRLVAVEAAPASAAALANARRQGVSVDVRNLERRPVQPEELARFDLALLDPPRAGASAQAAALAGSKVQRLVYASCDPESFARDARALVDGGYELDAVQPIDQFLWSAEVELVATFRRTRKRTRRA